MGTPPWTPPASPTGRAHAAPLPSRADVVVVGAGLAGAAVAADLAARGVDVALLEARESVGLGSAGRHLGHVTSGPIEPHHRVIDALGDARAAELYAFCRENHDLLDALGLLDRIGGWWVALDGREPAQLEESARALRRIGVSAEIRTDTDDALGGRGFGPALVLPSEGVLALDAVARLVRRAVDHGAVCVTGAPVDRIGLDDRGAIVHVGEREVVAEVVVLAAELGLPDLDPWFADKLTPVREQALCTPPVPQLPIAAARAGYGYTFWRQLPDGRLAAGGCRWATPHLEVGERDDAVVVPAVQQKIEAFVGRHLVDAPAITDRWSWIVAHACDGLPIVGPMPGAPRLIACAGFGGNEPGYAIRAARGVVDGLLVHGDPGVPRFFAPSRFL